MNDKFPQVGPAAPLDCEECGEAFPRQDLDLVTCAVCGCGEQALVCRGCLDTAPSPSGKPLNKIGAEFPPEVDGCRWMTKRGNWIGTYYFGSQFEKNGVRSHPRAGPTNPYTELLASHFGRKVLECHFWQMALGTTCPQLAKDSEFAKRSLDYIEQELGKDALAEILAALEEGYKKQFDMAKGQLATPVNCEECGMYFLRKFLEQVACGDCDGEASVCQGCDGEASVCQGCLVCEELDEGALVCEGCVPYDG